MSSNRSTQVHIPDLTPESLMASGRASEKLSLTGLRSKMKRDPEGYEFELNLLDRHFDSSLNLFDQQAALNINATGGGVKDTTVAKDLGDMAMFLAQMAPIYPNHLSDFPKKLSDLLGSAARSLPSFLRCCLAQALILLTNRKVVDVGENLALFMELQTLGDRALRKLAFSHVVHNIRRLNKRHKNNTKNKALQNVIFSMLQEVDELKAKRALVVLSELQRRRVWLDDRTANAICSACLHSSSRIRIYALLFLLGYEMIQKADDSGDSSSEDDAILPSPQVAINKEVVYKVHHKGTLASRKKKQAKLQRAIHSMKKQQKLSSENNNPSCYSPLHHLKDAQGFVEELFARLQSCNEQFEVKMMMLKVIARTIGLHQLVLLKFYPFLQRYVQPHQRDITELLAAAVQACHDMAVLVLLFVPAEIDLSSINQVPPDAVEPLFRQIVNRFVHDRSPTEAVTVGLNVVREICLRMPLLMTEDLLRDLVLYKKSHEKAVSSAARSLMMLFRVVCPSLLVKRDRGRLTYPKARPKEFGQVDVDDNVPGVELLENEDSGCASGISDDEGDAASDDGEQDETLVMSAGSEIEEDDGKEIDEVLNGKDIDDAEEKEENESDGTDLNSEEEQYGEGEESDDKRNEEEDTKESKLHKKRKTLDCEGKLNAADTSLRALKRLAGAKMDPNFSSLSDRILSNEEFQRIKELKINIRRKPSKEERLALVRAGREDRGKYQARTAVKQIKKEHKKAMPLAAQRAKVARSRLEKKKQHRWSGKQVLGKKAWK